MSRPASRESTNTQQNQSVWGRLKNWPHQRLASNAARCLTLASIVYATWHYGAADTSAVRNLSLSLGAALILVMSCKRTYQLASKQLPILFFTLILVWLGYALLQRTTIAAWLPSLFHGVVDVREQFGSEPIARLDTAILELNESRWPTQHEQSASVAPEETRQALVPFCLAGAAAVLSAILFNTRKRRLLFLWTVIVNASALAFWGIIQKARGGHEILPGVENTFSSGMPFASFIYKNAGAAALLPALAGVAALFYCHNGRGVRSGPRRFGNWGTRSNLLETRSLVLFSLGVLLVVGLAASLSRGAWLAGVLATLVVGPLCGLVIRRRDHLIVALTAVVAAVGLIAIAGIRKDIGSRAEHVSVDRVTRDSRWSHWVDGFSTALAHFPSGSGFGTYGYATLPNQSSPRPFWFREAHNQYLEVFTESGLIGIALMFTGILWLTLASWRLRSRRNEREKRSWGLLGIALVICGGVQSVVDFVVVIPANLILYASLIGIIGSITLASRSVARSPAAADHGPRSTLIPTRLWSYWNLPAVWCGVFLLFVAFAYRASSHQLYSEQVLASTSLEQIDQQPDPGTVSDTIAKLSDAIARHPQNGALYLQRANWHLAQHRLEIMKAAAEENTPIDWANTQLENLFVVLLMQSEEDRAALVSNLRRTPRMRMALANAASDLSMVLSLAPLAPRGHLTIGAISAVIGMPTKPWLRSTSCLANNSSEMLYLNGMFAFYCDEVDLAVNQWSKSLSLNHQFLNPILELARQKLTTIRVATDLVPADRPELYVRLLEMDRDGTNHVESGNGRSHDRELAEMLAKHIESNERIEAGCRYATIAKIRRLLGDNDAELLCWKTALQFQARDPDYRFEYSRTLSRVGRNDEALKQAILGKTLNPADDRFKHLTSRIRQAMRQSTRR